MNKPGLFFLGVCLILSGAEASGESAPISGGAVNLQDLTQEVLLKNPAVQSKKAQYESLRAKVMKAWLPEDPMVGVDIEGQSHFFDSGSRGNTEVMASQTIPFPTKLYLNGVLATREADMAYQTYKQEERAAAWRVEQSAYQLALSQRTARSLEETQKLIEQLSSVVRSRYESNQTNQSDYLKIQIELEQISIEAFDWRQRARIAEAGISRQLGKPLETVYSIQPELKRLPAALGLRELETLAIEKRPELKMFAAALERARTSRLFSQTEWLPDITGRLETRRFPEEGSAEEYDNFIGFSVPAWSLLKGIGGGWHSAQKEVEAAERLYADMENETRYRVHEAYAKFKSAENAVNTYESQILSQAKSQVDIALSSYEAGRAGILDLIDAERTFKNTQIGYYRAQSDYEMALSDLRLAVGDDLKGSGESS